MRRMRSVVGGEDIVAVVGGRERAGPGVEDLDDVGAGLDLLRGEVGQHGDELLHQRAAMRRGALRVHQLLGFDVVARAAALDHVAGERERRAAEADDAELVGVGCALGPGVEVGGDLPMASAT